MNTIEQLLNEYSESHQNKTNQMIHKICVPLIEWSLLGMLWMIPQFEFLGMLNWASLFIILSLTYYSSFRNLKVIVASAGLLIPFFIFIAIIPERHILKISITVFILAWIGQFIGHKIEGKKPSFFKDLFFLLIGPLWVAEAFLRRFNYSLINSQNKGS